MNKSDYEKKARKHLKHDLYKLIREARRLTKLIKLTAENSEVLQSVKVKLRPLFWFILYSKCCGLYKFYRLPKIHKNNTSLRPVIDFTNSPKYNLEKYIAVIFKPYD